MSLSEVQAQYLRDSDEGEDKKVGRNLVEEQNYVDVILNPGIIPRTLMGFCIWHIMRILRASRKRML